MMQTNRRTLLIASVAAAIPALAQQAPSVTFGNRAHILVRPEVKYELISCFETVFGCGKPMFLKPPSMPEPIVAFRFPGGGSVSFEFTKEALAEDEMRRAAWMEIRTSDVAAMKKRILEAGLPQAHHPATNTFYVVVPGGQVLGIVPLNPGEGELK